MTKQELTDGAQAIVDDIGADGEAEVCDEGLVIFNTYGAFMASADALSDWLKTTKIDFKLSSVDWEHGCGSCGHGDMVIVRGVAKDLQ